MADEKKPDMKQMLQDMKQYKDLIKGYHRPLLEKDRSIGQAFQGFDKAIEDRVKEIASDSTK